MADWFHRLYEDRETFDHPDEERAFRNKQGTLTQGEVEDLARLLSLSEGAMILDAFCGNGRHAVCLAERGYRVVGVDTARSRVAFAHRWAVDQGIEAYFAVADARALPLARAFDALLILGGSFTHCPDWPQNVALLKGLRRVIKPGGVLLIDNPNPLRFWRIQHPDAGLLTEEAVSQYDLPLGSGENAGFVRYYCAARLQDLLGEAGFAVTRIMGTRDGGPPGPESPRLIVMGRPDPAAAAD